MDQRTLDGPGHTGHDDEHPERHVDIDALQVVQRRAPDLQRPGPLADRLLQPRPVVEVTARQCPRLTQAVDGPLEDDLSPGGPGAGAEVDDMVGDGDRLGLVLDDEHGVALVP